MSPWTLRQTCTLNWCDLISTKQTGPKGTAIPILTSNPLSSQPVGASSIGRAPFWVPSPLTRDTQLNQGGGSKTRIKKAQNFRKPREATVQDSQISVLWPRRGTAVPRCAAILNTNSEWCPSCTETDLEWRVHRVTAATAKPYAGGHVGQEISLDASPCNSSVPSTAFG